MGINTGIHPRTLLDVIATSMGQSRILTTSMEMLLNGESWGFLSDLAVKDMRLGVQLGENTGVPLEITSLVEQVITRYCDEGGSGTDFLQFLTEFLRRSGVHVSDEN